MNEETTVNFLTALFVVEVVASVVALAYILRVFRGSRSVLFRLFVVLDIVVVLVGALLLAPAIVALLDLPRLPFTASIVVGAILILLAAPIVHAIVFWTVRRRNQPLNADEGTMEEPPI